VEYLSANLIRWQYSACRLAVVRQVRIMEYRSRPLRIYSIEDLALQKKLGKVWIARKGRVYDVTDFVNDHPGGEDLITQFSGQDIGNAMEDEEEHLHSSSAYGMLEEYVIGRLGNEALVVSDGQCPPSRFGAQMLTTIYQTGLQMKIFIQTTRIWTKTTASLNSWTYESRSSVKSGRRISGISYR
jgi:cytochrome b involved in lipid metabolism